MTTPLLTTKLYIPPVRRDPSTGLKPVGSTGRPSVVPRPRLIERLDEGIHRKLTLVCAPAGFGKTTLVSEWLHVMGEDPSPIAAAWLSLDEGDNDPMRFLVYFIAALQTVEANIGKEALGALHATQLQPPPNEAVLTALINDITAFPGRIVLVLDEYHRIEAQPIHETVAFLLEHLPPHLHLVIATREDPDLPMARLRVRGQLTELRAANLRFTPGEAATFLNQVMGLGLSVEEVSALETRTEGWIAGLQLAALALQGTLSTQGREDVPGFIRAFAGDNRYIVDYLVGEVLQRQPEPVRSFLLQTSILDRLSGPLCDAVCFGHAETLNHSSGKSSSEGTAVRFGSTQSPAGQKDGRGMLAALERGNLFVVPLDDRRQWYRYHQLFADVLYAHLMEEQHDRVSTLHRRASEWYERNGSPSDAVRHALAAADFERAAGLVELAWPVMDESAQSTTWLGWVKGLPDELVRAMPVLSVGYAWALLHAGELDAAQARLRDGERWLDTAADSSEQPGSLSAETCPERSRRMVVVDEEQLRSLPASIATARAYHAQALGDGTATVKHAQRVLDLLPEGDHLRRGQATTLLGLAYWASGDLEAAHRAFADFLANMRLAGDIPEAISGTFVLADIKVALGRLHEASNTYQQSLRLAAGHGEPMPPGTEDLYRGIGELHCEWGDLETAAQHLLTGKKLGEQAELPDWQRRLCVAQARLKEAQGDLDGALELLDEAERLYIRTPLPDVRPTAALKTRIWVAQGRLTEALGWVRERDLSVDDDLSYLHEFEHVTLARVLIARHNSNRVDGSIRKVVGLLERLLKAAEEGGRTGSVIEILVLQALAHQMLGDIPPALDPLERALTLAEPEGYVRIFVNEGPPMAALLREAAKNGTAPHYVNQLRAAFGQTEGRRSVAQPLIEPLSERELDVLGLLATELNGPEIARELMVSLNTMRTHTKNIYGKLGVNSRRAAVRRAEELDLL